MWILAFATLLSLFSARSRVHDPWNYALLLNAVIALALLVVTCSQWRGKNVSGFLAIAAGLGLLDAVRVALA